MLLEILSTTCIAAAGLCVDYVHEGNKYYVVVEKPGSKVVVDVTAETKSLDSQATIKKVCSVVKCNEKN